MLPDFDAIMGGQMDSTDAPIDLGDILGEEEPLPQPKIRRISPAPQPETVSLDDILLGDEDQELFGDDFADDDIPMPETGMFAGLETPDSIDFAESDFETDAGSGFDDLFAESSSAIPEADFDTHAGDELRRLDFSADADAQALPEEDFDALFGDMSALPSAPEVSGSASEDFDTLFGDLSAVSGDTEAAPSEDFDTLFGGQPALEPDDAFSEPAPGFDEMFGDLSFASESRMDEDASFSDSGDFEMPGTSDLVLEPGDEPDWLRDYDQKSELEALRAQLPPENTGETATLEPPDWFGDIDFSLVDIKRPPAKEQPAQAAPLPFPEEQSVDLLNDLDVLLGTGEFNIPSSDRQPQEMAMMAPADLDNLSFDDDFLSGYNAFSAQAEAEQVDEEVDLSGDAVEDYGLAPAELKATDSMPAWMLSQIETATDDYVLR
ncbi:MAG TPA: hypothetical protein VJZ27_13115, partial [Aggregatilineales bacterium]|nr:hypothetical protein [Aggregatilineales bacterium]